MRESTPGDASSPRHVGRLAWCWNQFLHHLPVTLLLAVALPLAHGTDWIKVSDGFLMRTFGALDRRLAEPLCDDGAPALLSRWTPSLARLCETVVLRPATIERQLLTPSPYWGDDLVVVRLTPQAHQQFLHRTTPAPRARLACVLDALALRIEAIRSDQLAGDAQSRDWRHWRPVVAVDVDIATAELDGGRSHTGQRAWRRLADEGECFASRNALCGRLHTPDDAMRCALKALNAAQAIVLAVTFPRHSEASRALRNAFIRETCICDGSGCPRERRRESCERAGCRPEPLAYFLSSQLMYVPGELVYEYPTTRRPDLDETVRARLPERFPGLGHGLAEALALSDPGCRAWPAVSCAPSPLLHETCLQAHDRRRPAQRLLDDDLVAKDATVHLPNAFEYRPLRLGAVASRISVYDVVPQTGQSLAREAANALGGLTASDAYVVAIDSGAVDDKYVVPLPRTEPLLGAWVHAAVAATIRHEETAGGVRSGSAAYLGHVSQELLYGLVFVALTLFVGQWPRAVSYPVIESVVTVLWPLLVASVLLLGYAYLKIEKFAGGDWTNPLPMLIGMVLHVYIGAAMGCSRIGERAGRASDRALRALLQWAWTATVAVCVVLGVKDAAADATVGAGAVAGAIALGAVVYVSVARRVDWLPLPLRLHLHQGGHA